MDWLTWGGVFVHTLNIAVCLIGSMIQESDMREVAQVEKSLGRTIGRLYGMGFHIWYSVGFEDLLDQCTIYHENGQCTSP